MAALPTWLVAKFALRWFKFERCDHLDVIWTSSGHWVSARTSRRSWAQGGPSNDSSRYCGCRKRWVRDGT